MKLQHIREMAQELEISTGKMKKSEIIRTIQRKEHNIDCFDTGNSSRCGQDTCLWQEDCK